MNDDDYLILTTTPLCPVELGTDSGGNVRPVSDELLEFLAARLDEDEAAAKAATPGPWEFEGDDPTDDELFSVSEKDDLFATPVAYTRDRQVANGQHMARHDPARVLREVAVKRAVVALHAVRMTKREVYPFDPSTGEPNPDEYDGDCSVCGWFDPEQGGCLTLRELAAIYSNHPGYDPAWKP